MSLRIIPPHQLLLAGPLIVIGRRNNKTSSVASFNEVHTPTDKNNLLEANPKTGCPNVIAVEDVRHGFARTIAVFKAFSEIAGSAGYGNYIAS